MSNNSSSKVAIPVTSASSNRKLFIAMGFVCYVISSASAFSQHKGIMGVRFAHVGSSSSSSRCIRFPVSLKADMSSSSSSSEQFENGDSSSNMAAYVTNGAGESQVEYTAPSTFREAELIGLRFMQEGQYEEAIKLFNQGMKLPGSRKDVVRKQSVSGPSPVGGAAGGREGGVVMSLDEFEYQAAHYNIACAYSKLGKCAESVASLSKAIDYGFNNLDTMKADPDLRSIQGSAEFGALMKKHEEKSFNPFSFFGKD